MKKWHNVASEDNRFATWTAEQLWDHFTSQVVDGWPMGSPIENYHTWLRWIHRADVSKIILTQKETL